MTTSPGTARGAAVAARAGLGDAVPVLLGMVPFGLVVGASSVEAGLGVEGAVIGSLVVFAGAAQLAAIDLLGRDAPLVVVVATIAVINLRFLLYSASLSPLLADRRPVQRLGAAYVLTDQAYALATMRAQDEPAGHHLAHFLGAAVSIWANWQVWTLVGALVGATIPPQVPLAAAIPLVFLVLLVPAVRDRPTAAAAVASGLVATAGVGLPANGGLLLGAVTGMAVGTVLATRTEQP